MDKTEHLPVNEKDTVGPIESIDKTISPVKKKQEMFNFFGKSHMMMIASIFVRSETSWRFNELRDEAEISQTTLSTRLTDLVEADLITRRSYDEIPPRVEYEATQKLRDLEPIIKDLFVWWRDVA